MKVMRIIIILTDACTLSVSIKIGPYFNRNSIFAKEKLHDRAINQASKISEVCKLLKDEKAKINKFKSLKNDEFIKHV